MKFISSREIRNRPTEFRAAVEEDDIVLTMNGKPFAIAVAVDEEEMEETLGILRQVRALQALSRIQARAEEAGLGATPLDTVTEEVRRVRRERKRSR